MDSESDVQQNEYFKRISSAFLLDSPKLVRILNIIEQRYAGAGGLFEPKYEVTLARGKSINLVSVDDLLKLDNAVRNAITSLSLRVRMSSPQASILTLVTFDDDDSDNITLHVGATDPKIASQLFAELEEQVERTLVQNWVHRYLKSGTFLTFTFMSMMLAVLGSLLFSIITSDTGFTSAQVQALSRRAENSHTVEQKIDFLFEMQRRQLAELQPRSVTPIGVDLLSTRVLLIILPLLLVFGCIAYLIATTYPRAVFLWGDYAEHYSHLLSKRKTLWTVVVIALFVGAMSSLLATGVTGLLGVT
jgi:hypothetical protein